MAMTGAGLAAAIESALQSAFPGMTAQQISQLASSMQPLATAIVSYITANAVVNVTQVTGVSSGGGVSGPGTGTIS